MDLICRTLPSGMVNGIFPVQKDLRNGEERVAILEQFFQDAGQGLRRVFGGVVEQDDGAGLNLFGDTLGNLRSREAFPVQTVHVPYRFKWMEINRFIIK